MRTLFTMLALLAGACAGDSPAASARACNGRLYDRCLQEHDCMPANMDCHNFVAAGFQACSKACTPGEDAPCGTTLDGQPATCNMMGTCEPPAANDCELP
ncbi:MAG TPA: hypothetical protein VFT22_40915 [Kofleriaceae bacterium]|nr:hypothetical protein [Kofleriaceae bacterium]